MEHILFFSIAFVAEILGTVAGFGSATILTPFAGLVVDIKVAIVLVAFFHFVGNVFRVYQFRKIDWSIFLKFGVPGIIASIGGALLFSHLETRAIQLIFGLFLILYTFYSLFLKEIRLNTTNFTAISGGVSTGFLAGIIGTGGALRVVFLNAFHLPKNTFLATSAMISAVVDATRIPVYFFTGGTLERTYLVYYVPILIIVAFLGTWVGRRIVDQIPQELFHKLILVALFLVGAKFIFDFWT